MLQKMTRERYQGLSEKEKTKSVNMLVNDTEIFLKKKKAKNTGMVVSAIKIFQKMKNKG